MDGDVMKQRTNAESKARWARVAVFTLLLAIGALMPVGEGAKAQSDGVEHWSGTVEVRQDVFVGVDERLVIDPGCNIRFLDGAGLYVAGTLEVLGSEGEPVELRGDLDDGDGAWIDGTLYTLGTPRSTIELEAEEEGPLGGSRIEGAILESLAVVIDGRSPTIEGCSFSANSRMDIVGDCSPRVSNSTFSDNGVGDPREPWFPQVTGGPFAMVSGPTLVCSFGTTAVVSNCTFARNGGFAIDVMSASPTITGCQIYGNRHGGIRVDEGFTGHDPLPVISGNVISGHGTPEQLLDTFQDRSYDPSVLAAVGVHIDNADVHLMGNFIEGNEVGVRVMMNASGEPLFFDDRLEGNLVGVYSYHGSPVFRGCTLDNLAFDFYLTSYSHVKAFDTTFNESRLHIEWESRLETDEGTFLPLAGGVGLVCIVLTVLVGGTELGKVKFFAIAFPLFSRLRREEVLDQFTRGQIYGLVRGEPGIHYTKIKKVLKIGNGTLAYHLDVLEKEGFIRSSRDGLNRTFRPTRLPARYREDVDERFPLGEEVSEGIRLSDLQEAIVALVRADPGITQASIVERIDVPKQTVSYNIKNLSRYGVIDAERRGRLTRCYPVDANNPSL
jgi:predicted transcriptional regulator